MHDIHAIEAKLNISLPSPVEKFAPPWPGAEKLQIHVKRDDLIHPIISGNKWRKLKYAIAQWPEKVSCVISFGGGFSNHLHALAYVCHQLDIPFVAIVRGDYSQNLTPTLRDMKAWGADVRFVSKIDYRQKDSAEFVAHLHREFCNPVIIPEGGSQREAMEGLAECVTEITQPYDVFMCPVGTGATLAGIAGALPATSHAEGIAVLKGENYLEQCVRNLLPDNQANWRIEHRFYHGGYAKNPPLLSDFCRQLLDQTKLVTEPVYSGKLFYAAARLIAQGYFSPGTRLMLLHSGGLQGLRSG